MVYKETAVKIFEDHLQPKGIPAQKKPINKPNTILKSLRAINMIAVTTFEKQEGYIDDDGFNKITCAETLKFFRSLGGTERVYKKNGKIVKLVSTKPDGIVRVIYEFRHS